MTGRTLALVAALAAWTLACRSADHPRHAAGPGPIDPPPRVDARATTAAEPARDAEVEPDAEPVDAATAPDSVAPVAAGCAPPADRYNPTVLLSATGCVDPGDPRKPAPGLIPFEIASPLWSDGAEKRRFLALPPGGKIGPGPAGDPGRLALPEGTVLVKSFLLDGRFVETRLFVKMAERDWVGYSYVWNDDQSEAQVIPGVIESRERVIQRKAGGAKQIWTYPSRRQCLSCHTEAAGFALGTDLAQWNREVISADGAKVNQLDALSARGIFERPLERPYPPALPTPTEAGAGSLESRARSYLHVNCSTCHRPGAEMAIFDVRYGTRLADAGLCNVVPIKPGFEAGARLLTPGNPAQSVLSLRMHAQDNTRMPPLASAVLDQPGMALVDAWIGALTRCP